MRFAWGHLEVALYVAAALAIVYRPPALAAALKGFGSFIERHFGDSIGVYLLHLGIALIILGDCFSYMTHAEQVGNSLLLTAMGILKLKTVPGGNGNSTETVSTTTARTTDPPPDSPDGNPPAPQTSAPASWGPKP